MSVSRLRSLVLSLVVIGGLLVGTGSPAAASDVDLGDPQTLEELLASPEYLDDEHADVARLYQAFFNREPDVAGLVYWIGAYEDGTALPDLAWSFSNSTEFRQTYGTDLTDAEFLEIVYGNVLGRGYDQAGFDYWLGEMTSGLARHDTVFWIVAGAEFKTNHPFAGTAPDVHASLLTPAEVRAVRSSFTDFETARYELTEAELLSRDACSQLRFISTNTYTVFHATPDRSEFVYQEQYAFSRVADAERVMANHRTLTSGNCRFQVWEYDDGSVLTERYAIHQDSLWFPGSDDSMIIEASWTWQGGPTFTFFLFLTRDDHVVTLTDIVGRDRFPDYGTASVWAEDTSAEVRSILAGS